MIGPGKRPERRHVLLGRDPHDDAGVLEARGLAHELVEELSSPGKHSFGTVDQQIEFLDELVAKVQAVAVGDE